MFDTNMLALLICPVSNLPLQYDENRQCLISANGKHEYPIVNGIPVLMLHTTTEE